MRALLWLFVLGCSNSGGGADASTDAPPPDVGPPPCTSSSNCPSASEECYFPIDGGCSIEGMMGVCLTYFPTDGCAANVACGCNGTTISVCAPPGYVDRVSFSAGACPADAGSD